MIDTEPRSLTEFLPVGPVRRPNILLVILDCVGQAAISEISRGHEGLPLPPKLRGQFAQFSRSVSSGSWTLPSHASLLTGLPVWEHGVHGRAAWKLPAEVPTLAGALGREGYATACISANGFLGAFSGLCRGFDETHVGSWSEVLQRGGHRQRGPTHVKGPDLPRDENPPSRSEGSEFGILLRRFLLRNPALLDGSARTVYKFAFPQEPFDLQVASWIEPTLRRWLGEVPKERPAFCTINYLDAHEPYYREESIVGTLRQRWKYAMTSQDQTDYLVHPRPSDAPSFEMLRQLYLGRARYLMQRLGLLVDALEDAGRWEETLLIVTADHGQAFGEGGSMFHGLSIDDSVLRVPLLVRFPHGAAAGQTTDVWTSGLDVAETIRSCALGSRDGETPNAAPSPRTRAVSSVSDGVAELATSARFPKATQERLDHVLVAVYSDADKVSYDACHDRFLSGAAPSGSAGDAVAWARKIGQRMQGSKAPRSDHLAAWGYE